MLYLNSLVMIRDTLGERVGKDKGKEYGNIDVAFCNPFFIMSHDATVWWMQP